MGVSGQLYAPAILSQVKGSPVLINRVLAGLTPGLDALERRKNVYTCRETNHVT